MREDEPGCFVLKRRENVSLTRNAFLQVFKVTVITELLNEQWMEFLEGLHIF